MNGKFIGKAIGEWAKGETEKERAYKQKQKWLKQQEKEAWKGTSWFHALTKTGKYKGW